MYAAAYVTRHNNWDPPLIISEFAPDFVTGFHNTAFCQKNEIQFERNHNKPQYCLYLGPLPTHWAPVLRGLRTPYLGHRIYPNFTITYDGTL